MIANINYRGKFLEPVSQFPFTVGRPCQYVHKCQDYTIVIFTTGNCRIMGCKHELDESTLPFKIAILGINSVTVTASVYKKVIFISVNYIIIYLD